MCVCIWILLFVTSEIQQNRTKLREEKYGWNEALEQGNLVNGGVRLQAKPTKSDAKAIIK